MTSWRDLRPRRSSGTLEELSQLGYEAAVAPPPRPVPLHRRIARRIDGWRRIVLPLPDELIDRYLGHGERKIHSDHPSLRAFVVRNGVLVAILLVFTGLFLGISFGGSLAAGVLIGVFAVIVATALFLRRLSEAYTSYVITDVRIIVLRGVFARKMHSIPWVRVTDLSMEQNLAGRVFGFATVHIESANEDSGLRDLLGVSDPMRFHGYLVDMVVAKQGSLPYQADDRPATGGLFQRFRSARERGFAAWPGEPVPDEPVPDEAPGTPGADPTTVEWIDRRPGTAGDSPYYADQRQVVVGAPSPGEPPDDPPLVPPVVDEFVEGLLGERRDEEDAGDDDLRWDDGR